MSTKLRSVTPNATWAASFRSLVSLRALSACIDPAQVLPSEVFFTILQLLNVHDLCTCSLLNRTWNLSASDNMLWKAHYIRKYSNVGVPERVVGLRWKTLYGDFVYLKVVIPSRNVVRVMPFNRQQSVREAAAKLEELFDTLPGPPRKEEEFGLVQLQKRVWEGMGPKPVTDPFDRAEFSDSIYEHGVWMSKDSLLVHYDLRSGDKIAFRPTFRRLNVLYTDGSRQTLTIDDTAPVRETVDAILARTDVRYTDEFSLKLVDSPDNQWLDPNRTLTEQGVPYSAPVLLQQKFMIASRAADPSNRPFEINLLYSQCRNAVVSGLYKCTMEQAIYFAALQCQITLGVHHAATHVAAIKLPHYLPEEYRKVPAIKDTIIREHKMLAGLFTEHADGSLPTSLNAKARYVQLCSLLPGYGATLFEVQEQVIDSTGRFTAVNRRLGISGSHITCWDIKTENPVLSFPLTNIQAWAHTPSTISFQFGTPALMYTVRTRDGPAIASFVSGYVEHVSRHLAGNEPAVRASISNPSLFKFPPPLQNNLRPAPPPNSGRLVVRPGGRLVLEGPDGAAIAVNGAATGYSASELEALETRASGGLASIHSTGHNSVDSAWEWNSVDTALLNSIRANINTLPTAPGGNAFPLRAALFLPPGLRAEEENTANTAGPAPTGPVAATLDGEATIPAITPIAPNLRKAPEGTSSRRGNKVAARGAGVGGREADEDDSSDNTMGERRNSTLKGFDSDPDARASEPPPKRRERPASQYGTLVRKRVRRRTSAILSDDSPGSSARGSPSKRRSMASPPSAEAPAPDVTPPRSHTLPRRVPAECSPMEAMLLLHYMRIRGDKEGTSSERSSDR